MTVFIDLSGNGKGASINASRRKINVKRVPSGSTVTSPISPPPPPAPPPSVSLYGVGVNMSVDAFWTYATPFVNTVGALNDFGVTSSPNGLSVLDANRDSNGNVKSVPAGQTSIQFLSHLPPTLAPRRFIWDSSLGGLAHGMASLAIANATAVSVDLINRVALYTPVEACEIGGSLPPSFTFTPAVANSDYPINFQDRPVADPGGVLTAEHLAFLNASCSAAPKRTVRFMDWNDVNRNSSPLIAAGAGAAISSITHVGAVATVTTATPHGLIGYGTIAGSATITLTGASPAAYNVTDTFINVIDATHFSYTMLSTPASNATVVGSYTFGDFNYQFWRLANPSAGSEPGNMLGDPIYTSANRNRNRADPYWHDGVPTEVLIEYATAANANAWVCLPWNADATYYAAVAALWAAFAAATGRKVIIEMSNEVWNPGFAVYHQNRNEANILGISLPQNYARKAVEAFASFETAFASAGMSSQLVRLLAWQNAASTTNWDTMLDYGTVDAHTDAISTAIYYGDNSTTGIPVNYTGSTATLTAAMRTDISAVIGVASGHIAKAIARGKLYHPYEGGYTLNLSDHAYSTAYNRSTDAFDNELLFLQKLELVLPATSFYCAYNSIYPLGVNNFAWGQMEAVTQINSLATTPKLWAHSQYLNGYRVLTDATGLLSDIPSTSAVGTVVGTLTASAAGVTWSLSNDDGGRMTITSISPTQAEVRVAAGLAGTANGARSITARQTSGASTKDTVFAYNVAPLFQDNFNDNVMDVVLWNLAGYHNALTANSGTATETGGQLQCKPTASVAGGSGYVSNVRNLTGTFNFIRISNIPPNTVDELGHFTIGMPGAASYATLEVLNDSGTNATCKLIRHQGGVDTTFAGANNNIPTGLPIWLGIKHDVATGDLLCYTAPSTAPNPPAIGNFTFLGNIPFASLPTGFDITACVLAFGAYTWDGVITATSVIFDGFNTAT